MHCCSGDRPEQQCYACGCDEAQWGFPQTVFTTLLFGTGIQTTVAPGEWIEERATAKANKDFAASDAIRDKLASAGIELRDSPEGTTWVKKSTV